MNIDWLLKEIPAVSQYSTVFAPCRDPNNAIQFFKMINQALE